MAEVSRLHAVISGRVQGVGFRYFTLRQALALGLTGWAKNLPNGCVEVEAEGDKSDLEKFLTVLEQGPIGSHVADVQVTWKPATGSQKDFEITI